MNLKITILSFFLLLSGIVSAQSFNYSYTDPCNGNVYNLTIPYGQDQIAVTYYGQVNTFTANDFNNGAFDNWAAGVFNQYQNASPCGGIGTAVTVSQTQSTALNVISIFGALSAISDMASSGTGNIMAAAGSVNNVGGNSNSGGKGGKGNKNNQNSQGQGTSGNGSQSGGASQGQSTSGGNNTTTSGNNSTQSTGSQSGATTGNNGSTTGGESQSGAASGGGSQGQTQSNGNNSNGSSSSGTTTGSNNNSGGSSETTPGATANSGGSTGSSETGGAGNTNTGGGSTGGSGGTTTGSTGSGGSGGNGSTSNQTQTTEEKKSDAIGGTTNAVKSGSGNGKSSTNSKNGGRPSILMSSDLVGFQFNEGEVNKGTKVNAGYSSVRYDGLRSHGVMVDYTSSIQGGNITGYYAWINPKAITLLSNTVTIGFAGSGSLYNTVAFGQMRNIKKFKAVYMLTASGGQIYKEAYYGSAAIVGGNRDFKVGKRIDIKAMALFVYAPFVRYYDDAVLKSPYVILPIVGVNLGVTKTFKLNFNFGGAYSIGDDVLNYTVMMGTRLAL